MICPHCRADVRHKDRAGDRCGLHAAGTLTHAGLAWLAEGWWSPVAALRPSTVVGRVERAVASVGGDPATRAAATVGFLTWPKAPREVAP